MEAVLNVDNLAYCKLEIEDANMPASFNLIDHIVIHEGFGISVPTLTLFLFDQTGTLQNEMNLVQGSKCTISLAKDSKKDRIIKRTFSLWGMKRGVTSAGPHLEVVFILDVPKWSAGVYCENFRSTSDEAMQRLASSASLRYDGPGGTDDKMNWLNINTTRSSFSEDVAMRGYANSSSCMARVLTMDSKLRYKDLFDVMKKDHTATLLLNTSDEGQKNPFAVRETQESSTSGIMAHWFNYGQIQHEHTLDKKGQQKTDRILAPVLGDSFPISDRVKGLISDAVAARVTYTGWDPGTEPNPGSNIHEYYERAFYQNLRGLGLFSERIRSMVTVLTDISSFDCVKYVQSDPIGHQMVPSKSLNGKYLVAGKTIRIKNGHVYSEVFDLVRPYVSNPGKSQQSSGSPGNRKAKANEGPFDLASDRAQQLSSSTQNQTPSAPANEAKPEVDRGTELVKALDEYADAVPDIPAEPMEAPGSMSPSDKQAAAQDKVRNALAEVHKDSNPISDAVNESKAGFDPNTHHTVKKVSAPAVKTSANETISAMQQQAAETGVPPSGPEGLDSIAKSRTGVKVEKPVLDRYSADGTEIKKKKFESAVTPETAEDVEEGDFLGDLQKGGVFVEDFLRNGRDDPSDFLGKKAVTALDQEENKGSNFVFPASQFGLGGDDVSIGPKKVAEFLLEYAKEREDPQEFLRKKGPDAYRATFGEAQPDDAKSAVKELARISGKVKDKFGDTEVLAEPKRLSSSGETPSGAGSISAGTAEKFTKNAEDAKEVSKTERIKKAYEELSQSKPNATVKSSALGLDVKGGFSTKAIGSMAKQKAKGSDPDYAQAFEFQFGQSGVSPLVERVAQKGRDQTYSDVEIVETTREAISWAQYTRVGSNKAKQEGTEEDGVHWEFPHVIPFEKYEEGEGETHWLPDTPSSF